MDKAAEKSRFRELSTDETGSPKFPYKFKEIISLILLYVELIMLEQQQQQQQQLITKFILKIFRMAWKSLQE